ncbi:MAG: N-acetylmuramoyl-L-alanine amidase, partial [Clostridiales bacterium]|nr:N-acetylmuramoyl-L-alanine amidase [Clostridiales bacterium]
MPFLFLSPSTQYFNPYVTTGDERYWMNALADEMMPYLHASGITVTRNDPDGSAAQSIRDSNASRQDFHLALHSNAAPQALAGRLRGVDFYYYPTSEAGLRMANILVDNMKTIYPLPDRVQARPSTIIGEVRRTRVPAVLAEIGYHDNVDDANWLTGNLDAVARTLSLGVTEYFGVPFLTPGDEFEAEAAGADGYLRLRSYPEPDAEILAQLPNDTPVTVLGNFDTWYTVRADTLYGFAPIT